MMEELSEQNYFVFVSSLPIYHSLSLFGKSTVERKWNLLKFDVYSGVSSVIKHSQTGVPCMLKLGNLIFIRRLFDIFKSDCRTSKT